MESLIEYQPKHISTVLAMGIAKVFTGITACWTASHGLAVDSIYRETDMYETKLERRIARARWEALSVGKREWYSRLYSYTCGLHCLWKIEQRIGNPNPNDTTSEYAPNSCAAALVPSLSDLFPDEPIESNTASRLISTSDLLDLACSVIIDIYQKTTVSLLQSRIENPPLVNWYSETLTMKDDPISPAITPLTTLSPSEEGKERTVELEVRKV